MKTTQTSTATESRRSTGEQRDRTRGRDRDASFDPSHWQAGAFDYQRLDAYRVCRRALVQGHQLAQRLPRGQAKLADQLRRALLSAHLQIAEAASRTGADRAARFRCARGEASEAAAALEAITLLELLPAAQAAPVITLLARLAAMLNRLSHR